jgi:predicted acetyltransferase
MTTVRPIMPDELAAHLTLRAVAFNGRAPSADEVEARRRTTDLARCLGAFDDGRLVGTAAAEAFPLTVPGGRVGAAGILGVTVLPTHRRRGILTELLRRLVADSRERGEPLALLYASEGGIYGRFGFGAATYECDVRVARRRGAFRRPVGGAGLRLLPPAGAADLMARIAAKAAAAQPGSVSRPPAWWRWLAEQPPPAGRGDPQVVVREQEDGFAMYGLDMARFSLPGLDGGTLRLAWLLALGPEAHAALWRHCLDVDLVDEVVARHRPVDEPLRHLLADPRAVESRVWDGLWARLVDVEAALNGRAYGEPGRVVLRVEDGFCPWNTGTYAVEAGGCTRTDAEPDLALPADALAACYLGGNRFTTLCRAGLVEARSRGAAERADVLFASPRTPWCPYHF